MSHLPEQLSSLCGGEHHLIPESNDNQEGRALFPGHLDGIIEVIGVKKWHIKTNTGVSNELLPLEMLACTGLYCLFDLYFYFQ